MKPTCFAALLCLAVAGCGAPGAPVSTGAASTASAEAWALAAYSPDYGGAAAETCLEAFRADIQSYVNTHTGALQMQQADGFSGLLDFMCKCARGTSTTPCPQP